MDWKPRSQAIYSTGKEPVLGRRNEAETFGIYRLFTCPCTRPTPSLALWHYWRVHKSSSLFFSAELHVVQLQDNKGKLVCNFSWSPQVQLLTPKSPCHLNQGSQVGVGKTIRSVADQVKPSCLSPAEVVSPLAPCQTLNLIPVLFWNRFLKIH